MSRERRRILVGAGIVVALAAALVLSRVLATIALAVAAAYMLLPVHCWLVNRGLPDYWSAIVTSLVGVVVSLALVTPFGFVLYARREALIDVVTSLNGSIPISIADETVVLDLEIFREAIVPNISRLAVFLGQQLSVLSAKFVVYAFVVFALLYYHRSLRSLAFGPIPQAYHEPVERIHHRIRDVLFGHYVLVILGGAITFVAGLGIFAVLGYSVPYVLALAGAVLWILPFISAAPLVFVLATAHVLNGQYLMAVSVAVLGGVFVVAIPSLAVDLARKRLGDPERLSQALYFVGFVGGGLTVGLVGFVLGPITLAILVAILEQLAEGNSDVSPHGE